MFFIFLGETGARSGYWDDNEKLRFLYESLISNYSKDNKELESLKQECLSMDNFQRVLYYLFIQKSI